jgi:hypothetical protein
MSGRGKTPASRKSASQNPTTTIVAVEPASAFTPPEEATLNIQFPTLIPRINAQIRAAQDQATQANLQLTQAQQTIASLTTANQTLASEKTKLVAEKMKLSEHLKNADLHIMMLVKNSKKLTEAKGKLTEKNLELARSEENYTKLFKTYNSEMSVYHDLCESYQTSLEEAQSEVEDEREEAKSNSVPQKFLTLVKNSLSTKDSSEKLTEDLKKIEGAIAFEPSVVSIKDDKGRTALHIACDNNNLKVAKCILEVAPESFFLTNEEGFTAIEQAVINNNEAMFIFLFVNRTLHEKIYVEQGLLTTKLMRLAEKNPAPQLNQDQTNNNNATQNTPSRIQKKLKKFAKEERAYYTSWLNANCTSEIGYRTLDKAITELDKLKIRIAVKAMAIHGILPVTSKLTVSSEYKNQMVTRKNGITETATEYMNYKAGRYSPKK